MASVLSLPQHEARCKLATLHTHCVDLLARMWMTLNELMPYTDCDIHCLILATLGLGAGNAVDRSAYCRLVSRLADVFAPHLLQCSSSPPVPGKPSGF